MPINEWFSKWLDEGVLGLCVFGLIYAVVYLFKWATTKHEEINKTHLERYDSIITKYDSERNELLKLHREERQILQDESNKRVSAVTAVLNEIKMSIRSHRNA